jgi:hypothetical protein
MSVDAEVQRRELNERRALRIVGVCFLLLAAYIASESALDLWSRRAPEHSIPGMALACVSLVVMPLLSRAKRKVGHALGMRIYARGTPHKQSFARTYPPSCWLGCCSTVGNDKGQYALSCNVRGHLDLPLGDRYYCSVWTPKGVHAVAIDERGMVFDPSTNAPMTGTCTLAEYLEFNRKSTAGTIRVSCCYRVRAPGQLKR